MLDELAIEPPATARPFVPLTAFAATLAVMTSGGYVLLPLVKGSGSLRAQPGAVVLLLQVHPVPAALVAVTPVGSVSTTVTDPNVGAAPVLVTVIV